MENVTDLASYPVDRPGAAHAPEECQGFRGCRA